MNKELILTYIYGSDYRFKGLPCDSKGNYLFDGNLMTAAMNKMVERGEWAEFYAYISFPYLRKFEDESKNIHWLFQPARFFDLMSEALEKGILQLTEKT
ncbi:MAG: hypothetical protein A4E71_02931 [Smithella sp. PtaU1.Bin162]|nr:MAG: hypothetical protein A4E71_02931 [Smithella sp. PtaU1.Bin162]